VYREVKERILTGALPGGELISEGEIAAQLGVSRTPVREGFLRLEAEGWMRLYPKRGALIVPVAPGEAEYVVEARYLVESHSAQVVTASSQLRDALGAALARSLERQHELREAADVVGFSTEDADFHRLVVAGAANPLLIDFYDGLRDRQRRMTASSITRDPQQLAGIIEDHADLARWISAGEPDAFAGALWLHMRTVHGLGPAPRPGERA
jgi:DNA-binding GntR family transcriptional regulator